MGGLQGGASRWPLTNQRAANEVAAAQPIRPRHGEKGGPRDVTTPPGQSTDLPLVLAIGEGEERFCAPKPANEERHTPRHRGSADGGGRIKGQAPFSVGSGYNVRLTRERSPVVVFSFERVVLLLKASFSSCQSSPCRPLFAGSPVVWTPGLLQVRVPPPRQLNVPARGRQIRVQALVFSSPFPLSWRP